MFLGLLPDRSAAHSSRTEMYKNNSRNTQRRTDHSSSAGVFKPSPKKRKKTLAPTKWERELSKEDKEWLAQNERTDLSKTKRKK